MLKTANMSNEGSAFQGEEVTVDGSDAGSGYKWNINAYLPLFVSKRFAIYNDNLSNPITSECFCCF